MITLSVCTGVSAKDSARERLRETYIDSLPRLTNPDDSLSALYNILDLSGIDNRAEAASTLLDFGMRHGKDELCLEMIRNLANYHFSNDSIMAELLEMTQSFEPSDLQKETLAFVKVFSEIKASGSMNEDDRQTHVVDLIKEFNSTPSDDPYDQVVQLFILCINLGGETQGELLESYFNILENKIKQLPVTTYALRNLFFSQESITFTNNGEYEKAVKSDRQLMDIVDIMQSNYAAQGRIYRNFDTYRYLYLRRMLRNFPALTLDEAEKYYSCIMTLADSVPDIKRAITESNDPHVFLLLKQGRYKEAIPMLKKRLSDNKSINIYQRRFLLRNLIKAAEKTGDDESLINASRDYVDTLEKYVKIKNGERYRELQIVYEISRLKEQNASMELQRQMQTNNFQNTIMNISIGAAGVLLLVACIFVFLFFRFRKLSKQLSAANRDLRHERDQLKETRDQLIVARDKARTAENQKTEFINYISHEIITPLNTVIEYSQMIIDSADDSKREYLDRFSQVLRLNTGMLRTFVTDVQEISIMEHNMMSIKLRPSSLKNICTLVVDSVRINVKPEVELKFAKAGAPDTSINTDPYRVEIVLLNLMSNAVKFTESGSIVLDYDVNGDNTVTFSVTDTGIGVPAEKRKTIFERFRQIDPEAEGTGLGLHVSRLIATLLNGSICLDKSYKQGARFLFTIPVNKPEPASTAEAAL